MARRRMEIKKGSAMKILGRLFRYMAHYYKWELLLVIVCIAVTAVAGIALVCSCLFAWLPALKQVSSGFAVIFCTLIAAGLGAALFPVQPEKEAQP